MSVYFGLISSAFERLLSLFEYAIERLGLGRFILEMVFIVAVYRFIIIPLLHPNALPSLGWSRDIKSEYKFGFGSRSSQKRIEDKER